MSIPGGSTARRRPGSVQAVPSSPPSPDADEAAGRWLQPRRTADGRMEVEFTVWATAYLRRDVIPAEHRESFLREAHQWLGAAHRRLRTEGAGLRSVS